MKCGVHRYRISYLFKGVPEAPLVPGLVGKLLGEDILGPVQATLAHNPAVLTLVAHPAPAHPHSIAAT